MMGGNYKMATLYSSDGDPPHTQFLPPFPDRHCPRQLVGANYGWVAMRDMAFP